MNISRLSVFCCLRSQWLTRDEGKRSAEELVATPGTTCRKRRCHGAPRVNCQGFESSLGRTLGAPAKSVIGGGSRAFDGNADGNVSGRALRQAARQGFLGVAEDAAQGVDGLSPRRPAGAGRARHGRPPGPLSAPPPRAGQRPGRAETAQRTTGNAQKAADRSGDAEFTHQAFDGAAGHRDILTVQVPPYHRGRSGSGGDLRTHGPPPTRHVDLGSRHGTGCPQASQR